ncbi:MAG TPA: CPBP family intramembrane glutamic endopeptidase [Oleiagrimonas sp.]|nr:CPBP family intramembrane glutamic endopeptidase [Oleiagrimonas sp.]
MIISTVLSAIINLLLFAAVPFLGYIIYQKWRNKRTFREITRRAGLRIGKWQYLAYSVGLSCITVAALIAWPPPMDMLAKPGSAAHDFVGLGLTGPALAMALIYGVIQAGLTEELLFRGLIAGSLGRRLPIVWANIIQAVLFLLPHLLLLRIMPDIWGLLLLVFAYGLVAGWLRIKSGSIAGPWLIHACADTTVAMIVAVHTIG